MKKKRASANKNASAVEIKNLRKVLAVTAQINSTLKIDELLGIIMNTAANVVKAEAASLMLIDTETHELTFRVALGKKSSELVEKFRVKIGEGIAGSVAQTGKSVIVNNAGGDKRFAKRFDQATGFQSKAILCVPMRAKGKIIGVLEALNPLGRKNFTKEDLRLFETFADQASLSVENARMHEEMMKQEKARYELMLAREIQQNFLPDLSALQLEIDVAAKNLQAKEVGGDFYDVIQLDETRTGIVLGDVSGKGVPGALYVMRAISDYRYLAPSFASSSDLLKALNRGMSRHSGSGMFITLVYLVLDSGRKTLSFASAGHHPILKKTREGKIESLAQEAGLPLGLSEETDYKENCLTFQPGETFFLYTDGVIEARNKAAEEFTLTRLISSAEEPSDSAEKSVQQVLERIKRFTQGAPQHDDLTLLALKIHD